MERSSDGAFGFGQERKISGKTRSMEDLFYQENERYRINSVNVDCTNLINSPKIRKKEE